MVVVLPAIAVSTTPTRPSVNTRLAAGVVRMLARHGFDVTLQQKAPETVGDFDTSHRDWEVLDTVKGVWDNPRTGTKGLNDMAPASMVTRRMTISYRADLKPTSKAVDLRVVVNGNPVNVLSISEIGERVGLRLMLDEGTEK